MQVVDGDPELVDGEVARLFALEPQEATAYRGVQEADASGGVVALAAGLDGGEGLDDFHEVLEGFEEAALRDVDAETAGAGEGLDDAGGAHAAEEGDVEELRKVCQAGFS